MKTSTANLLKSVLLLASLPFALTPVFAQKDSLPNTIYIGYEQTHFDQQFPDDWRMSSLGYSRHTGWGTLLGRVNYANRFARCGWQAEGEAYPVLNEKLYAYAGLSYGSDAPVFPQWRAGSTLYYAFAKGWEAEGGFRYLRFDQSIWMGTAGVSKYLGAWLLNARTFFSVQTPANNLSYFIKAQRFLNNEKDYVWVQAGSGISPDESRNIQLNTASQLVTKRVGAGAKLSVTPQVQLSLTAGYASDEYRTKMYGGQYNGSVGVSLRF